MKTYDAYLFDWDGTIARSVEMWLDVVQRCLAERDIRATKQQISALYGDYEMPVKLGLPATLNDKFHGEMAAAANEKLSGIELYDGAEEVLRKLKQQGKKLALISNSRRANIETVLAHRHVQDVFDTIVAQEDIKAHKPNPEALLLAMQKLNAQSERTLMLGDTRNDIEAARNADVDSLLFYPPSHTALYDFGELQAHHPTHIIHGWREFAL
ncbi:MAG TPA: HAD family hydrolase [Candidatus Saccharimonadales bacterium]